MKLYNGTSLQNRLSSSVLKHLGSDFAAAQRLESMFSAQETRNLTRDGKFAIMKGGMVSREETIETVMKAFCSFLRGYTIDELEVNIKSPLRLNDCWEDDPIGSGGLAIFNAKNNLSQIDHQQLKDLFGPFEEIVYGEHVHAYLDSEEMKKKFTPDLADELFQSELKGRVQRLMAIGMNPEPEIFHETVWIDLTLKARQWALENDYDSFVYKNHGEGGGDDSYVMLKDNQVLRLTGELTFNPERYMDMVLPTFIDFLHSSAIAANSSGPPAILPVVTQVMWSGHDPLTFWDKRR